MSGHSAFVQQGGRDDGQSSPGAAESSCLEAGFDGPVVQGLGELQICLGTLSALPGGNDWNGHRSHL